MSFCTDKNGKSPKWQDVYEVNKNNLRSGDPNLIFPGEKLKLPDGYELNKSGLTAKQLDNLEDWGKKEWALKEQLSQMEKLDTPKVVVDEPSTKVADVVKKTASENPYDSFYDYSLEKMDGKNAKVFKCNKNSKWTYMTRKGPSVTSTQNGDDINADSLKASDWEQQENAVLQFVPTFAYKYYEYGRLSIQSGVDYTQRPGDESMNPNKKADASVIEENSTAINDQEKVNRWKEMADKQALFDWTRGTGLVHIDENGKMTLDRVDTSQEQNNLYKTATNLKERKQSFTELLTTVKNKNESLFQAPVALWDGEVTNWREGDGIKAQFIVEFKNGQNGFVTFDDDIDYFDAVTRLKQRGDISKAFYVDTSAGSEYLRYWSKEEKHIQEQGIKNPQHGGGMLMLTK